MREFSRVLVRRAMRLNGALEASDNSRSAIRGGLAKDG